MSQNSPADKERTSTSKVLTRGIEGKVLLLGITACVTQIRKYVNLPLQLNKQTNKQTNKQGMFTWTFGLHELDQYD